MTHKNPPGYVIPEDHIKVTKYYEIAKNVEICASCEKCVPIFGIPSCEELKVPVVVAASSINCPLEKLNVG